MSIVDALLRRLDAEQADHARQALTTPQNRDAFEYGRMAGLYAGLEQAKTLLLNLMDEADRDDVNF